MGRHRKKGFNHAKMLSSRVEFLDHEKFEFLVKKSGSDLQKTLNAFVVAYISGNVHFSGTDLYVK